MSQYMYCYIQMKNLCSNTCKKLHKITCNFFTGDGIVILKILKLTKIKQVIITSQVCKIVDIIFLK